MMWNPSVNAIWARAWPSSAASGRLRSTGYLEVAAAVGSVVWSSLQSISAAPDRSSSCGRGFATVDEYPIDHGPRAGAHACHQQEVYAEPGCERDRAVQLEAAPAHRGDRRATSYHRHDVLVVIRKGCESGRRSRQAGSRRQHPLCRATEPSCGSASPSGPVMFATSPTAYTRGSPSASIGLHVDAAAPTLSNAGRGGQRGGPMPPPHTTHRVGIGVPSPRVTGRKRPPSPWCPGAARPLRYRNFST